MVTSACGHLEVVRVLLAANADVNAAEPNGRTAQADGTTALMVASGNDRLEIAQLLKAAVAHEGFGFRLIATMRLAVEPASQR